MKPLLLFTIILLLTAARLQAQNVVRVTAPGSLASQLTQAQRDTCTQLTIQGKLNSADIRVLRQMGGYKEDGSSTGQLSVLNLTDAEFVTDKEPYMVLDTKEEQLTIFSAPGNIREGQQILGLPLNYSRSKGYASYTNGRRTDLMLSRSTGVSYYKPKFFIGKRIEPASVLSDQVYKYDDELMSPTLTSVKATRFLYVADSFEEKEWQKMKRKKVTHFKGHNIVNKGGKYLLNVYSHKDYLPHDMFYKCNKITSVIMPIGIRVDKTITDETSHINYTIPYNEVTIRYQSTRRANSITGYYLGGPDHKMKEKKIKLIDKEADDLINLFDDLKSQTVEKGFWIRHPKALFRVERKDVDGVIIYRIDSNYKFIEKNSDKQFYKPSKALLAKMEELGIIKEAD